MEGRLLLKDCAILGSDGQLREKVAILVEGETISRVAPNAEIPSLPGDWEVNAQGRLVTLGWVDCHSHLVGSQLVRDSSVLGRSAGPAAATIRDLETWQLSASELEALTAFSLARALRAGVTMFLEHLDSPHAVAQGLSVQASVAERLGARLVVSHATRLAGPRPAILQQLEDNASFVRSYHEKPLTRAALGFQWPEEGDDELLQRIGQLREELHAGAHYHLGLSKVPLAKRLEDCGLLGPDALVALGPACDRAEIEALARTRTGIVLGVSPLQKEAMAELRSQSDRAAFIGLGTGLGSFWWDAASIAWTEWSGFGNDRAVSRSLFSDPSALRSRMYQIARSGLEPGGPADLVIYDLIPPSGAREGSISGFVSQLARSPVAWTVVAGRVVVREGRLLSDDYIELAQEASKALAAIWRRKGAR
jgi:cytosine/adenosine deaminase-related metal-dependent hydrolase